MLLLYFHKSVIIILCLNILLRLEACLKFHGANQIDPGKILLWKKGKLNDILLLKDESFVDGSVYIMVKHNPLMQKHIQVSERMISPTWVSLFIIIIKSISLPFGSSEDF